MKRNTLLLLILAALAGCSASYKGDVKTLNNPDAAKNGSYIASQAETNQSGSLIGK